MNSAPRALSLAHLTVLELAPPDVVMVAARAGFRHVGLRLIQATPDEPGYPMLGGTPLRRATLDALAATGLSVLDVEVVRLMPGTDVRTFEPMLETAARLGARHVIVTGNDPDRGRLVASFAAFCVLAAAYGLTADLEFMSFTAVPTLDAALEILSMAAQPNAGVLVDSLHFDRSGAAPDSLSRIPGAWLHFTQLSDAPAVWADDTPSLIKTARTGRLMPGEGGIGLAAILAALPPGLPISLEIPSHPARAAGQDAAARARIAYQRTRGLLAAMD